MFCSGCGKPLQPGELVCSRCGRPVAAPVPPPPVGGFPFQDRAGQGEEYDGRIQDYDGKIKVLSIAWFAWAALVLCSGFLGMAFARYFLPLRFGPWGMGMGMGGWSTGPNRWFLAPGILHLLWIAVLIRTVLIALAAWGLWKRTAWGRILALILAILGLVRFPIGTAMGIWALILLLGSRNSVLYAQLEARNKLG